MARTELTTSLIQYFYPWPLVLVSTVDAAGKPNIITIGASSICCANPPVVGVALGVKQYSLELLQATGDFGVNLPDRSQLAAVDLCGSVSGRTCNKFELAGLTPEPARRITSPLIAQCPVSLECRVTEVAHLGSHDWVMGEIVLAQVAEEYLQDRQLDTGKLEPILSYWGEYWGLGEQLGRWGHSHPRTRQ